ncbi:MAG: OB-fold nucleic acid binding domain-containing protein, partial [Parachlamydia sp.]|nr:OB-fold nucleic acid binding domain-containing protein [Parachlamydia sp.]
MAFDYRRSHHCGAMRKENIGDLVTLSGWVNRRRDHGGLIFIDLRDRFGLTQLVFDPIKSPLAHAAAEKLRGEWVISIKGQVIPREEGMANPKLATGDIEILVNELEILSKAKTPPFSIADELIDVNEELRLKYRYLDIRRGDIARKLIVRHQAMLLTRQYLDGQGFTEITTPVLGKSTPEGARDYLVPSRVYPGTFYALPQSPQIFKQLLMVAG